MAEGEGGVDPPAVDGTPCGIRIAIRSVGARAPLSVGRQPELRRRKVEALGDLDQRMVLRRDADLRLVTQQFFGERRLADADEFDSPLDVDDLVDRRMGEPGGVALGARLLADFRLERRITGVSAGCRACCTKGIEGCRILLGKSRRAGCWTAKLG